MTAPTPEHPPLSWPLDRWALESLNEELQDADLWTPDTAGDCANLMVRQLPAILAALTELEGLRAEVARLPITLANRARGRVPIVLPIGGVLWRGVRVEEVPHVAAILRAAREAEEVSGG